MGGRKASLLAPLLAALLLTGCGAPAGEATPLPTEPAESVAPTGPQVQTHWDALPTRTPNISTAKRLSPGSLPDFTPGCYGGIVPYIGGEQRVMYGYLDEDGSPSYETRYLYGLSTVEGLLLTDPVFNSVYRLTWYDHETYESHPLPVFWVGRTAQDENGTYYNALGLLADDGSWYTGAIYRREEFTTLAVCEKSALVMADNETAVLVSLEDGSEIARYGAYDFLPEDGEDYAQWFFSGGMGYCVTGVAGGYFYYDPDNSGMPGQPLWIDGATGAFLEEAPMEVPEYEWTGRIRFDGGWYEDDGIEYSAGGELVLHYDDGSEEEIVLDGSLGSLSDVSARHLTFWQYDEQAQQSTVTLTDHALTVLCQDTGPGGLSLLADTRTGERRPVRTVVEDADSWQCSYQVLSGQGETLTRSLSYPRIDSGYFPVADETAYRLMKLEGEGCSEVFRIPRWEALDAPAE